MTVELDKLSFRGQTAVRMKGKQFLDVQRLSACLLALLTIFATTPAAFAGVPAAQPSQIRKSRPIPPAPQPKGGVRTGARVRNAGSRTFSLPDNPTDLQLSSCAAFQEPLTPVAGDAVEGENAALAKALKAFKATNDLEDLTVLTEFIKANPGSRWTPSLEANVGSLKYMTGYLTDALSLWAAAWEAAKGQRGASQMAMASEAFSNLVNVNARLGRQDDLRKYFAEADKRPFFGSVEARVRGAKEGLEYMHNAPSKAFRCGPLAVNTLFYLGQKTRGENKVLKNAKSTSEGTTLAQVKGWADQVGLKYQMAKRSPGAAFVTPAVMHWKLDHFAAIVQEENGHYNVQDPTFDFGSQIWMSPKALESETDGYFLIPASQQLPAGWQLVGEEEAKSVRGKGSSIGHPAPPGHCTGVCGSCWGMARASTISPQATLEIQDTPLVYSCPLGPPSEFSVNYNYLEGGQPSSFTFSNLGADWSTNWVSYLTVTSGVATVRLRTGGIEIDTQSGGVFPNNHFTQALLVNTGTNAYTRTLPDGTVETFNLADTASPPHIFMTEVTDPHGQSALITYDANFRVTKVTDQLGQVSNISYVSNTTGNAGFYKISTITDPFSRTCSFAYDAATTTTLVSITDQIGLVSKFAYDTSSSMITQMTTPYGTTSFYAYVPAGSYSYPPQGLKTTFPDGTFQVVENWVDEPKMTYAWDRHATQLYPNDPANNVYTHCEKTQYVIDTVTNLEGTAVQNMTHPLESASPIFYQHPGQAGGNVDVAGTTDLPSQVTRSLGNQVVDLTIGGTITPGDYFNVGLVSDVSIFYTVQTGDTLSSIASNIASTINASSAMRGEGVTAGAAGPVVSMHSDTPYKFAYFASVSSGGTETAVRKSHVKQTAIGTMTGTVGVGDVVQLAVPTPWPNEGGEQVLSYTVQTGDTLTAIVGHLVSEVNANTILQAIGVSASNTGTVMSLVSYNPEIQTWSFGNNEAGGGSELLTITNIYNGATELENYTYTPFGLVTQSIDSMGRTFSYSYAANNIDLLQKTETKGTDNYQLGAWTYNSYHCPLTHTDGSGQVWHTAYNSSNQPITFTDPNSNVTTLTYTGTSTLTVAGTVTAGNIMTLTVHDAGLSGGQQAVTYTVATGNTLANIATGIANAVNANTSLQAIGVSATAAGAVVTMKSTSVNVTTYTASNGGGTETLTLGANTYGYLTQIDGPLAGHQDITTITYDGFGRVYTVTDSEGYTQIYSYDSMDRPTQTAYPDGSTEQTVWNILDAVMMKDRDGRWTQKSYDSMRELSYEIDPLGRKTQYFWCTCGSLLTLTDPLGQVTSWQHDLQGRTTQKTLQDSTSTSYIYETWSSRLLSKTDSLGQVKTYFYNPDDTPYQSNYTSAINVTAPVTFLWDPNFKRMTSAQKNDWGTYSYTYNPYIVPLGTPATGGGMLATVSNNVIANSSTSYTYDVLGRTTNRSINSTSNSDTWTYDAMSRITAESNVLGSWTYAYVDDVSGSSKGTTRLASVTYPNSQVTNYSWYPTVNDERLQQIANLKASGGATISQYGQAYDSVGQITQWQQLQNNSSLDYSLGYDQAGQLVSSQASSGGPSASYLKQNYYAYDLASNRTSVQQSTVTRVKIGGTVTSANTLTITVSNPGLVGGQEAVTYTVQTGDTLSSIASGLAAAITSDPKLQAVGVNASTNGAVMSIKSASPLSTTYLSSTNGGATETLTLGITGNFVESAVIGGSKTTSDTVTITVSDPALSGGKTAITYTVLSGDTLTSIATGLKTAINGNTSLSTLGVTATSVGTVITIKSTSANATTYSQSTSAGATETVSLSINQNGPQTIAIGGTKTTGNTITITTFDAGLTGGSEADTYTVLSGDTLTSIATGIAAALNADAGLQGIGVSATSSGTVVTVLSNSINPTTLRQSTSAGATEALSINVPANGTQTVAIGGSKTTGNTLTLTTYDAALTGGSVAVSYTVVAADTLTSIATGLAAAVNASTSLSGIGVTGTSTGAVLNVKSASINSTTYRGSTNSGATEVMTLAPSTGVLQATCNNVNELTNINAGGRVNFSGTASQPLTTASISTSAVCPSIYPSTYTESTNATATETITLGQYVAGTQTATIGGTATTGDVLTIDVENTALSGGVSAATYTVPSGSPSTTTMATGVAAAINGDAQLQAIGVTATSSAAVVTITTNPTTYTTTNGTTEILTVYPSVNGSSTIAVSGSITTSDVVKITVHNAALSSGSTQISYTILSTDTLQTIATALVSAINASSALHTLGVTAQNSIVAVLPTSLSFTGSPMLAAGNNLATVSATNGDSLTGSANYQVGVTGTAYSSSLSGGATETMTFGANNSGNSTVTIGGTKTTGNVLTITTYNPSLAAGAESLSYTVLSTDTLTTIATALTSLINADSKLQSLGISAASSSAVISLSVNGGAGRIATYDLNGNMTSDGLNAYVWDAEDRLIQVTYPGTGNNSQFTYDASSGLVKIVETSAGTVTSTKQFIRCGSQMCEERNSTSAITKQFFGFGQTISGTNYFYTRDHLGSVRDMSNSSGVLQAHYEYGMWGEVTQTVGTLASDFQYAGYYYHAPSGLNLTTYRAYNPSVERWINRDPIVELTFGVRPYFSELDAPKVVPSLYKDPARSGLSGLPSGSERESINTGNQSVYASVSDSAANRFGLNLYLYCFNNPVSINDPSGLSPCFHLDDKYFTCAAKCAAECAHVANKKFCFNVCYGRCVGPD